VTTPYDVVVLLGTDHHRFERLVGWVDDWLGRQAAAPTVLVQHGWSAAPRLADGLDLVPYQELQRYMAAARAVVCHGGPATMLEVRRRGRRPIVVPRDPALREHIDDHQQLFCRRMAGLDLITLCETQPDFESALDGALRDPGTVTVTVAQAASYEREIAAAVVAAGAIVDDLAERHARHVR